MYKKRANGLTAAALSLCVAASGILGFGGGLLASELQQNNALEQIPASGNAEVTQLAASTLSTSTSEDLSVSEIASSAANSVVEITTEIVTTGGMMGQYIAEGAGSGVIISSDGYIVTNNHVIEDANKITVRLKNGESYAAELIGTDSQTDVAVVKIDASGLQPAVLGDSDDLVVGELAVAIGNPLGQLGGTVTDGIISALDRTIDLGDTSLNLLQTNAAINPGNSGGGLFNGQGELIGIVVAKSTGEDVEGLGFAIPINDVKPILSDLMQYGVVQGRIDIGMSLVDIQNAQTAMMYRVSSTGLYVKSVTEGSNAQFAGFQAGDLIKAVDGTTVETVSAFNQLISQYSVGDTVNITVQRGNQVGTLSLTLEQQKA